MTDQQIPRIMSILPRSDPHQRNRLIRFLSCSMKEGPGPSTRSSAPGPAATHKTGLSLCITPVSHIRLPAWDRQSVFTWSHNGGAANGEIEPPDPGLLCVDTRFYGQRSACMCLVGCSPDEKRHFPCGAAG